MPCSMAHDMARTQQVMRFADRALDGKLPTLLTAWRKERLSFEAMARRLSSEYGITVTGETLRRWCQYLEIPDPNGKQQKVVTRRNAVLEEEAAS